MKPYYSDDLVTLFHGDCREVTEWLAADVLVTDPPYPNNAGHFDDAVEVGRWAVGQWQGEAIVFWSEIEFPPAPAPRVAVHIWHRTNVNGKPYEPAIHCAPDGIKRRSLVLAHSFIHSGVGPGSAEYVGHPTQKPVAVMQRLASLTHGGTIADPFAGSGSTLVAAKQLGHHRCRARREVLRDRRPPPRAGHAVRSGVVTAPQARRALRLGIAAVAVVVITVIAMSAVVQMATRGP